MIYKIGVERERLGTDPEGSPPIAPITQKAGPPKAVDPTCP